MELVSVRGNQGDHRARSRRQTAIAEAREAAKGEL